MWQEARRRIFNFLVSQVDEWGTIKQYNGHKAKIHALRLKIVCSFQKFWDWDSVVIKCVWQLNIWICMLAPLSKCKTNNWRELTCKWLTITWVCNFVSGKCLCKSKIMVTWKYWWTQFLWNVQRVIREKKPFLNKFLYF